MKHIVAIIIAICSLEPILESCTNQKYEERSVHTPEIDAFFGDSTLTLISINNPEGYDISIFKNEDLYIYRFQRGDSINKYLALHKLPDDLNYEDSIGIYNVKFNIPSTEDDLYAGDMFFMDVNFDGEKDFLVKHHGYNREYLACFDLINGDESIYPGFVSPLNEAPYNNIVITPLWLLASGVEGPGCHTEFDQKLKIISIYEELGLFETIETKAEYFEPEYDRPFVRVTERKVHRVSHEGTTDEYYKLKNDTLTLVKTVFEPFVD